MSEIPGQSGHALPDLKPPVCATSGLMRRSKLTSALVGHVVALGCASFSPAANKRKDRTIR